MLHYLCKSYQDRRVGLHASKAVKFCFACQVCLKMNVGCYSTQRCPHQRCAVLIILLGLLRCRVFCCGILSSCLLGFGPDVAVSQKVSGAEGLRNHLLQPRGLILQMHSANSGLSSSCILAILHKSRSVLCHNERAA